MAKLVLYPFKIVECDQEYQFCCKAIYFFWFRSSIVTWIQVVSATLNDSPKNT